MTDFYHHSNKRTPCPVCGKDHGCRMYDDGKVWCLRVLSEAHTPVGYRFLGLLGGGMGASLIPCHAYERDRRTHSDQMIHLEREREARQRQIARSLPAVERDRAIRLLSGSLGLSTSHRVYLLDRGLSEAQIREGLYFTLTRFQQLPRGIPRKFPGVDRAGQSLTNDYEGIGCVLFSPGGLALGVQVRLTDDSSGGRYRWLSGGAGRNTSHLRSGELPLTFIRPQTLLRPYPALVEGTGIKPQLAADKLGQIVIGASGGQHAGSPLQLGGYLQTAIRESAGGRAVDIYPDAGDIENRHVSVRLTNLARTLERLGYLVRVAWWGQTTKGSPDVDELTETSAIVYMDWDAFVLMLRSHIATTHRDAHLCRSN